nr:zinc finger BED domain-containing protein RICESLEEPER 2-like [Tanacetum cinerariifolium]
MHIRCAAHVINLIIQDGMKKVDNSIEGIRCAVKWIKKSGTRIEKFNKCAQSARCDSTKSLILDCPTMWNSTYAMLKVAHVYENTFARCDIEDLDFGNHIRSKGKRKRTTDTSDEPDHRDMLRSRMKRGQSSNSLTSELDRHVGEIYEPFDNSMQFDILQWWKVNSQRFPILSLMARDVLAVPSQQWLMSRNILGFLLVDLVFAKKMVVETSSEVAAAGDKERLLLMEEVDIDEGMSKHNAIYVIPSHTKKVFSNIRIEKDFSGRDTSLFPIMLVPAQEEELEDEELNKENVPTQSNDLPLSRVNTHGSGEDRLKLKELMEICTNLQQRVIDLENTKTAQANKIISLKMRVKRLEKKRRSKTHGLKRLYKAGLSARVESSAEEQSLGKEDASKQGRNIADIDANA